MPLTGVSPIFHYSLFTIHFVNNMNITLANCDKTRQIRQSVVKKFQEITAPDSNITWTGSKVDLAEMIHIVYLYGELYNPNGRLLSFPDICRMATERLHVTFGNNVHSLIRHAERRKGFREATLMSRLEHAATPDHVWRELIAPAV